MPEIMSQDEIDALLKALSTGEVDVAAIQGAEEKPLKLYDFRRPDKFSKDQLRAIQMIHENFARALTTSLSTQVRSMVSAKVASVDQLTYEEFTRSVLSPTVMVVLEMYPLEGNAVMDINPAIVFAIIDRLLGGKGEPLRKARELTDIERTIVERVVMKILEVLEESWANILDVRMRVESMESNPTFVQIAPGNDMVLLITLELQVGSAEGMLNLCVPYFVIEPVVDKLSSQYWFAAGTKRMAPEAKDALRRKVEQMKVPLSLELGGATLYLSDIMDLRIDDVIKLDEKPGDSILIRVGNKLKFEAKPGNISGHLAAQVTRVLPEIQDGEGEKE